jgi:hypothetical protein
MSIHSICNNDHPSADLFAIFMINEHIEAEKNNNNFSLLLHEKINYKFDSIQSFFFILYAYNNNNMKESLPK